MALIMSKTLENGATGNYWRATPNLNRPTLITMTLYADEAHARANKPALYSEMYQIASPGLTKAAIIAASAATPAVNLYELTYDLVMASKKDRANRETNPFITATAG